MTTKTKILIGILVVINILIFGNLIYWIVIPPPPPLPRAQDARAIADMSQMKVKAEMVYEEERNYTSLDCDHDEDMRMLCNDIEKQVGVKPTIHQSEKEYCAYVKLNKGEYFCIDSAGTIEETIINPGKINYCDGTTFICLRKQEPENETADWKTYRNELWGYEIRYPEKFYLIEDKRFSIRISNVSDPWPQDLGPHEKATIDIYRFPNEENHSLDYLLSHQVDFIGGKKIIIGKETAVRKINEEFPGIFTYFVQDDGYIYVLRGASSTEENFAQYRELIEKIEDTFRFLY
ncbi:hypothetical protein KJA15_01795 [Patescibacteria group bacterium]|nr:hypothetical protein [Patescibacteria group bacterium]